MSPNLPISSLSSIARRVRSRRSPGSASPRSRKTLPLPPSTISGLLPIARLVVGPCNLQSPADPVDIEARGPSARRRLLLETVQHIDRALESYGVDHAIGIPARPLDQLEDAGSFTLPGLRRGRHAADLDDAEQIAEAIDDRLRKGQQIRTRRADPVQGPLAGGRPPSQGESYLIRYKYLPPGLVMSRKDGTRLRPLAIRLWLARLGRIVRAKWGDTQRAQGCRLATHCGREVARRGHNASATPPVGDILRARP